jgi:hypothetical protein
MHIIKHAAVPFEKSYPDSILSVVNRSILNIRTRLTQNTNPVDDRGHLPRVLLGAADMRPRVGVS